MGGGTGQGARSGQILHRHHQQVREWPFVIAEQHPAAIRSRPLSAFHDDRQCPGAAAAAARGFRRRAIEARLRLFDGGAAGVSLGRLVSRPGRADCRDLRLGQDLAAQHRLPRRGQGGIDRRSCLAGRLVREPALARLSGDGPRLCRLGLEPGVLSRGGVAQARIFLARGFPRRQLGGELPPPRRQ